MHFLHCLALLCACFFSLTQRVGAVPPNAPAGRFSGINFCGVFSNILLNPTNGRLASVIYRAEKAFEAADLQQTVKAETDKWLVDIIYHRYGGGSIDTDVLQAAWDQIKTYLSRWNPTGISEHVFAGIGEMLHPEAPGAMIEVWITDKATGTLMKRTPAAFHQHESVEHSHFETYQDACDYQMEHRYTWYLVPVAGSCSGPWPLCNSNECAPSIIVGDPATNEAKCLGSLIGCPCYATSDTQGHCGSVSGMCNENGCNGQPTSESGHGKCTGNYYDCDCNMCPAGDLNCDFSGCSPSVGTGGFGSNTGECQGSAYSGCSCQAMSPNVQGHCGSVMGPCDQNGCDGAYVVSGGMVCMGAFKGCPCYPS